MLPKNTRTKSHAALSNDLAELKEAVRGLRGDISTQLSFQNFDLSNEIEDLKAQIEAFKTQMDGFKAQMDGAAQRAGTNALAADAALEITNRLAVLENLVLTRVNEVRNQSFEGINQILSRQGETLNLLVALQSIAAEVRNLAQHSDTNVSSRLNEIVFAHLPAILEQIHETAVLGIDAIESSRNTRTSASSAHARPAPTKIEDFGNILARAQREFPTVFDAWRTRLDEMAGAFAETKTGNAANAADIYSRLFRTFVERHISGPVLDVGCGPFGRPYYLETYAPELISGIEPLPFPPNDEIQILRGISEYLPFAEGVFGTVISGTSLDHCLDLEQSLDEMIRVLAKDGVAILWIGSIPGSPQFQPNSPSFSPADRFHLFHFDIAWFEPLLQTRFDILDRVKLDRASYSHVFYCLRPLGRLNAAANLEVKANATKALKASQRASGKQKSETVGE